MARIVSCRFLLFPLFFTISFGAIVCICIVLLPIIRMYQEHRPTHTQRERAQREAIQEDIPLAGPFSLWVVGICLDWIFSQGSSARQLFSLRKREAHRPPCRRVSVVHWCTILPFPSKNGLLHLFFLLLLLLLVIFCPP